ncbi:MAG: T9SS type A sorting domain-containing protein [Bacteroidota bacterium]
MKKSAAEILSRKKKLSFQIYLFCLSIFFINTVYGQPPAFNCSDTAYLFKNIPTEMYGFNLSSGNSFLLQSPLIANPPDQDLNAFGYNRVDNCIWGYRTNTNQLVRVAADFTVDTFPIAGLPNTFTFKAGDIDNNGIMCLYFYNLTVIYRIDLNPSSGSYLQLLPNLSTSASNIADWAFSPVNNNIYAVDATFHLLRFDPSGTRTSLGLVSGGGIETTSGVFGAVFMDITGAMYLSENAGGKVFRIAHPHSGDTTAILFSQGPISTSNNDGAFCGDATITSIPALAEHKLTIEIYPNPTLFELFVSMNINEPLEFKLYDVTSRKLLSKKFIASYKINTEQFPNGVYLYEVYSKDGLIKNGKIIKE